MAEWLLQQFAKLWASLPWEFKSPTFLQKNSQLVSVMVSTIVSKTIRLSSILRRFAKYGIIAKLVQQLSTDGYVLVRVQLIPNSRVLTTCIAYINTNPISKIAYARILTTLGICGISQKIPNVNRKLKTMDSYTNESSDCLQLQNRTG